MAQGRDVNATGYLYFIYSREQEAVKVGFAANVNSRLPNLQSGNPSPLSVFATIPATYGAEMEFHRALGERKKEREWYPDDDLMFCLGNELLECWGDAVEAKVGRGGWEAASDEEENPAGVYLTEAWMRSHLPMLVRESLAP